MKEYFCPNPAVLEKLHTGPLGAHIDAVVGALSDRGYANFTSNYALRLFAALGEWLERSALTDTDLNEATVDAFLACRYGRRRPHRDDHGVLAFLLAFLRRTGVLVGAAEPPVTDPIALLGEAFRQYLISQRDLAPATWRRYVNLATGFLNWRFGAQWPSSLSVLCADDINRFILEQARRYGARHTQVIASALRSFLRFLLQRGAIAIDLACSVPTPVRRQLTGLPRFMPAEDVEHLLGSVTPTHPQGLRNTAILLLLARLGLRAGEVADLCLEDLDWEAGELVVHGKGNRIDRLPLPWEVGEALSRYLHDGRPRCSIRQVFICQRAPRRGFRNGNAVSTIVRRALAHADLHPPHQGAHLLRHSLATRLLREGASLIEIGELLRHRNLDTTRIYAKVDEQALRRLAPPWPGGGQ